MGGGLGEVMGQLREEGGWGGGARLGEVRHHISRQAVSFGHGAGHRKNDISMFYRCMLSNP